MRLIEVKILYNADYCLNRIETDTKRYIDWFIQTMLQCPDVIHVSKTIILPDGEHNDKR